jgi:uncharacterized metal-binding protein YceD (DUF177 family)
LKAFRINIIGLSLKAHYFDFQLGDAFFKDFGTDFVSGGQFGVKVVLDKKETFIEADFKIRGFARLVCDRSLEPYDEPMDISRRIVFKYGEEEVELSDEIIVIRHDRDVLDLGQYLYEFIVLEVPMKRLHPRFREDEDDAVGKMIYTSTPDPGDENDEVDPRWEQLKKLK